VDCIVVNDFYGVQSSVRVPSRRSSTRVQGSRIARLFYHSFYAKKTETVLQYDISSGFCFLAVLQKALFCFLTYKKPIIVSILQGLLPWLSDSRSDGGEPPSSTVLHAISFSCSAPKLHGYYLSSNLTVPTTRWSAYELEVGVKVYVHRTRYQLHA